MGQTWRSNVGIAVSMTVRFDSWAKNGSSAIFGKLIRVAPLSGSGVEGDSVEPLSVEWKSAG